VICGNNGVGKTNLLEAIYLLSTGRSFRTTNLKDLIKEKANYFYIEAEIEIKNLTQIIKIYYDLKTKKITINSKEYQTFSILIGILCNVLITSDDFNIINGKPQTRRNFLNLHLAQENPLYIHHYLRFIKALKQRNYLLKTNKFHLMKGFDHELCKSGSFLINKRFELVDSLKSPLNLFFKEISTIDLNAKIKYFSFIDSNLNLDETIKNYLQELEKTKEKEKDFKTTLVGPHRDDFQILLSKKIAKNFASEGQKKLLLFSLKLAQWEILTKTLNLRPIFLIDDFDAHLDNLHKNNLKNALKTLTQVFITIPKVDEKYDNANIINIENI